MKAQPRRVLLDTNLLLLWLVAQTDPKLIGSFKRVQMFSVADIESLRKLLRIFPDHITTPHILSETSNFIDQAPQQFRTALITQLRLYAEDVAEVYKPSVELMQRDAFSALGLTDAAIAELSAEVVVMTMDYRLSGKIEALGGNAFNFSRQQAANLLNK